LVADLIDKYGGLYFLTKMDKFNNDNPEKKEAIKKSKIFINELIKSVR
jgi:hypothetical protein